jgi:hypothetical protein
LKPEKRPDALKPASSAAHIIKYVYKLKLTTLTDISNTRNCTVSTSNIVVNRLVADIHTTGTYVSCTINILVNRMWKADRFSGNYTFRLGGNSCHDA